MLLEITIWSVLSAAAPLLAPVLSLFLIAIGKILWDFHQRLNSLEEGTTRQSRTIYGDEKDPQQTGLSEDLYTMEERVAKLEERVANLEQRVDQIKQDVRELLPD